MVFLCLRIIFVALLIVVLFNVSQSPSYAQEDDNLRAKIQNPVDSVNLINRTIMPIIYAPGPILGNPGNLSPAQGSSAFGLGDH
jgi:hypothetical protein